MNMTQNEMERYAHGQQAYNNLHEAHLNQQIAQGQLGQSALQQQLQQYQQVSNPWAEMDRMLRELLEQVRDLRMEVAALKLPPTVKSSFPLNALRHGV
jgi:small-conductance mechanosensitive channel